MKVKLLIAVLLVQLELAQVLEKPLECKNPRSKICQLQTVSSIGLEVPKFPNLAEKHTLIIRSGDVPFFNESFTSQFGSVTKVTLGRLNIKALHIPSNWVSLNAENNQIRELIVDDDDDDGDDDNDSNDIYLSDGPIDSNVTPESPVLSVHFGEDTKELAKTGNATDSNLKTETPTAFEEAAKNDNITDSELGFAAETPTVFEEAAKNDNTTDSELEFATETQTGFQEPFRGKSKPNHRRDPTEDDIGEYNTENPAAKPNEITEDTFAPMSSNPADSKVTSQFAEAAPSPSVYKLQSLNLANNELQSIRKLKYMVNLEVVRLDGNELEFIEMATFGKRQLA